jgi:hypothetical protein
MNRKQIDEALELCEKATKGYWVAKIYTDGASVRLGTYEVGYGESGPEIAIDDARLIAAARDGYPAALRQLREAMDILWRYREVVCIEAKARALLAEYEKEQ